ncbi:MAG: tetratricopeptide repeat protein [Rhodocyclaceae bacterium]|nr:tetratricopeptide repeat protein [Rhodocyclaceae bacterium]MBX3667461.1 tetratricopeptide repeat protein [Rhodocyclaceae bacterium]
MILHRFHACLRVLPAAVALFAGTACADIQQEIQVLARQGNYPAALQKLDAALGQSPKDASLLFLRGVLLADSGRKAEAVAQYERVIEQFPELPEAYNNLAALTAASGQYDRARWALESALRADPNYALAQENLGDLYLRMAALAYEKAGRMAPERQPLQNKLQQLRTLDAAHPPAAAQPKN